MPNLLARTHRRGLASSPGAAPAMNRTGQSDSPAERFDRAIDLLESNHWSCAFAELSELANQGHAPAARIALMLARRGTSLFGGAFPATAQEQARWQRNGE